MTSSSAVFISKYQLNLLGHVQFLCTTQAGICSAVTLGTLIRSNFVNAIPELNFTLKMQIVAVAICLGILYG